MLSAEERGQKIAVLRDRQASRPQSIGEASVAQQAWEALRADHDESLEIAFQSHEAALEYDRLGSLYEGNVQALRDYVDAAERLTVAEEKRAAAEEKRVAVEERKAVILEKAFRPRNFLSMVAAVIVLGVLLIGGFGTLGLNLFGLELTITESTAAGVEDADGS